MNERLFGRITSILIVYVLDQLNADDVRLNYFYVHENKLLTTKWFYTYTRTPYSETRVNYKILVCFNQDTNSKAIWPSHRIEVIFRYALHSIKRLCNSYAEKWSAAYFMTYQKLCRWFYSFDNYLHV